MKKAPFLMLTTLVLASLAILPNSQADETASVAYHGAGIASWGDEAWGDNGESIIGFAGSRADPGHVDLDTSWVFREEIGDHSMQSGSFHFDGQLGTISCEMPDGYGSTSGTISLHDGPSYSCQSMYVSFSQYVTETKCIATIMVESQLKKGYPTTVKVPVDCGSLGYPGQIVPDDPGQYVPWAGDYGEYVAAGTLVAEDGEVDREASTVITQPCGRSIDGLHVGAFCFDPRDYGMDGGGYVDCYTYDKRTGLDVGMAVTFGALGERVLWKENHGTGAIRATIPALVEEVAIHWTTSYTKIDTDTLDTWVGVGTIGDTDCILRDNVRDYGFLDI